jgi:homoserine O-acetyltransferase
MRDHEIFKLGNFLLQSGDTLRDGHLAYKTWGTLNKGGTNCIVLPTAYNGTHAAYEGLIGKGKALDPSKYLIVSVNQFSGGLSSSPSNTPAPFAGPRFPKITHWDNVHAQHRLLTERFGVRKIALAGGFSMGAQQANHWAAIFPGMVERLAPWCGSAKTAPHNHVFLEGVRAALTSASDFQGGWYATPPMHGLRAVGRVWAGWGLSQAFYRNERYRDLGFSSVEDFMVGFWEARYQSADANNLIAMLSTWQASDISANQLYKGDFKKACGAIRAKAILLPCQTDMYFPPEDNVVQAKLMKGKVEVRPLPSDAGHVAPAVDPKAAKFLDRALGELLAR